MHGGGGKLLTSSSQYTFFQKNGARFPGNLNYIKHNDPKLREKDWKKRCLKFGRLQIGFDQGCYFTEQQFRVFPF